MVVWWSAQLPRSKKVPGSNLSGGLYGWSLHVLLVLAWVFFRYSSFLPQSKDMHVRLIGGFELSIGVIVSVCGCLSKCGPAIDWQHLPLSLD